MQPFPTWQNYGYTGQQYAYPQSQIQAYQDRMLQAQQQYNPYQQMQMQSQVMQNQIPLNGKMVDGIDVVKAFDTPLDGSIVYFPSTTGDCIYTKQIQADGTSRINTYKINNEPEAKAENPTAPQFDMAAMAGYLGQFKQEVVQEVTDKVSGNMVDMFNEIKGMLPIATTKGGTTK